MKKKSISISSRKQKGRRLQQYFRDILLEAFSELEPDDVRSTPMGVSGADIQLSPAAKKLIPFSIECKNREDFGNSILWSSIEQSEKNANGLVPIVVFKKNRTKTYAIIEAKELIRLVNIEK